MEQKPSSFHIDKMFPTSGKYAGGPGSFHDKTYKCLRVHKMYNHKTDTIMINMNIFQMIEIKFNVSIRRTIIMMIRSSIENLLLKF